MGVKRVIQINATCGIGSTGRIAVSISELLFKNGIENYILYSNNTNGYKYAKHCSHPFYTRIQAIKSKLFGNYGFNSHIETRRMINEIERFSPDVVVLHNIHGHDCHIEMLISYLETKKIKVLWTFHDCWAVTAYCPHFTLANCNKWKVQCEQCPQRNNVSWFFDRSKELYNRKKRVLSALDFEIIAPSSWLADVIKQSFLSNYRVHVIKNGIDLNVFKPTPSDFRARNSISEDKFIILGVAYKWGYRKGLDVFIELANRLDLELFQIVLVGTDSTVDKHLPTSILSIHRTHDQIELAQIYSVADVFINPTREEVLGLVNVEANACGTPVVTFRTGGSPECISVDSGVVVECNDLDSLEYEILKIAKNRPFTEGNCIRNAERFDKNDRFLEYVNLIKSL